MQAARASIRLGIESAKTNALTRSAVCASPRQIGQCGALEPGGWSVPSSELTPLLLHKVSVPSTASTISGFLANEGAQQNALAKTLPSSATIATHAQCVRRWRNRPMWRTLWARAIAVKPSAELLRTNLQVRVRHATHATLTRPSLVAARINVVPDWGAILLHLVCPVCTASTQQSLVEALAQFRSA